MTERPPSDLAPVAPSSSDALRPGAVMPGAPPAPRLTPAQGGWAALTVLLMQNVVSAVALSWLRVPLGAALLLSFAGTALTFFLTQRATWRRLVADSRWRTPPQWGVALGAFALAFVASRGLLVFLISLWPGAMQSVPQFLSSGADVWALLLVAGVLIPIAEEIAFRGVLMRGLEWTRGALYAALLSSLLFGLAHGAPAQVLAIWPLAWLMARAVQHSGSLWTSVVVHILNNTLAVGLGAAMQHRNFDTSLSNTLGNMDMAGVRVPLGLGLAGLLLGVAALAVGTLWLSPRHAPQRGNAQAVWTPATALLLALVLLAVGLSVAPLLLHAPFSGLR